MSTFHIEDLKGIEIKGLELDDGDAKISINGSEFVDLTNLPVVRREDSSIFDLNLTAEERVVGAEIRIEDQSTPITWLPLSITIEDSNVAAEAVQPSDIANAVGELLQTVFAAIPDAIAEAALAAVGDETGTGATGPALNDIVTQVTESIERPDGQLAKTIKESTRYNFRQTARLGTSSPEMEFEPVQAAETP